MVQRLCKIPEKENTLQLHDSLSFKFEHLHNICTIINIEGKLKGFQFGSRAKVVHWYKIAIVVTISVKVDVYCPMKCN